MPSRRLLRLVGDDRLVQQIQRGSEAAFEVAFERHAPAILGYCRHMLGTPEEAEDAVQHTFAAAYSDLQRGGDRTIALKPWLFTIARNRCLSLLRARREQAVEDPELVTTGLAEQVEQRAELRQLLADVRELPDEQREALLLAEVGDLPQADIARVLGCEVARVKGLVYRARSALIARRDARELPCEQVREQLSTLRGGALRRAELRLHLRECPGCRAFREDVRRQRQMLSIALPVAPTLALKASILTAAGVGAGAGAAGVAGGGGAAAVGLKLAVAGALAIGGGTAVVVVEHERAPSGGDNASEQAPPANAGGAPSGATIDPIAPPATGVGRLPLSDEGTKRPTRRGAGPGAPGRAGKPKPGRGRGPIVAPPPETPVRRGPPVGKGKPDQPGRSEPPANAQGEARGKADAPGQANGQGSGQAQGKAKGKAKGKAQGGASQPEAEPEEPEPASQRARPNAPGLTGETPGKAGATPGKAGASAGKAGASAGKAGDPPGHAQNPPGHAQNPPGHTQNPPGKPSQPPWQPSDPPGKPSDPPGKPSDPPGKPSDPPSQPSQPSGKPTQPPGNPGGQAKGQSAR